MLSLSLTLTKRLSNSKPLSRIYSHLIAYTSSATASSPSPLPPSPRISAPSAAPWLAAQSRGIALSGSDVRVGNLSGDRGRAHEVLKMYRPCEGTGKTTLEVSPHTVAGYSTVADAEDDIKREAMARRGHLSKSIKELRFLLCQSSPTSSSARAFVERNYKELKTLNPKLPILIRESTGIEPQLWARYDLGVEKGIKLEGLSEAQIFKALEDLVKAGQSLK